MNRYQLREKLAELSHEELFEAALDAMVELKQLQLRYGATSRSHMQKAARVAQLELELDVLQSQLNNGHGWLQGKVMRQAARIREMKQQAAEDIVWMSGLGEVPDEGLKVWRQIHKRWLT